MDLFSFVNSTAVSATTTVKAVIALVVLIFATVGAVKRGFSFAGLLTIAATAGFICWLTLMNGFQIIGKMISATVS